MASKLAMDILISLPRFGDGHVPMPLLRHAFEQTNYRAIRTAFQELLDEFGIKVNTARAKVSYTINHFGLLKDVEDGCLVASISRETWEVAQCEGQRFWDAQYSG